MKETIFVIGGCRSGKSKYALGTADKIHGNGDEKIFIATCVPLDNEMKQRIARHQKDRSQGWVTVEEPLHLPQAITERDQKADVILVDCLTLWINNLLMQTKTEEELKDNVLQLVQALEKANCPIVVVSNEVGAGIVPENKFARQFRDIAGFVNQSVARCAGKVVWMVAGIPVTVKG